jgi:allantoicase
MSINLKSDDPRNGITVDLRDQRYLTYPDGQIRRLSPEGVPIPKIRMSKKERLKLRKEYREARGLEPSELADKILETPVINPTHGINE